MTVKNTDLGISIGFRESEIFVAKRVDSFDIQVKLDPSFSANLGGLCGQFNSTEASGEILGGDGYLFKVDSPEFFVASWKVLPSNNLFNRSSLTNDHPPTADLIKKTPFACKLYRKEINYGWDAIAGLKGYQGLPPSAIGLNQCQNPTRNQGNQTIFEAESQRLCGYHGLLVPECQHLPIEVLEFTERICQMDNREVGYLDLIEPLRQTIHRKCATILSKNLSCPKACSSRGLCSEIGCLCDPGFTGYACQNEITPRFSCPALVLKHQS